jgi:hypothetical protein
MTRSVPEWIGKDDDEPVPLRVRLRVFERQGGHCAITGRKIMAGDPWECDHTIAVVNGGQNRESNLRVILKDKHTEKTAEDMATKSKIARVKAKHLGQWPKSKRPLRGRGFPKSRRASAVRDENDGDNIPETASSRNENMLEGGVK